MAIGNIDGSTAWSALFGRRLVHGWSSKIGNGAASARRSAAIVGWQLTKARPGKLGESSQPARRTDAERAGGMCGYRRTLGSCSANTRATAWRSVSSSEIGTTDPTDSMLAESKIAQHSKLAPKRLAYTMP